MAEISNEKRKFSLALAKAPVSALETGVCERSGADVSAKLIDGHPHISLRAGSPGQPHFAGVWDRAGPVSPPKGRIAILGQSGAFSCGPSAGLTL